MINLEKGSRINLQKEAPGLKKVYIGLGWDPNTTDTGKDFDLDASVFMLGANGKIPNDKYFIFYNNLKSVDGSVEHLGDNLTGGGNGDDETVKIDLDKVSNDITDIVFVVSIYDAEARKQNFGQVRNSFIRIYDPVTNNVIAKYDLEEDFSSEKSIEFGRLYKKDGEWRFQAVGQGYNDGLAGFTKKYAD